MNAENAYGYFSPLSYYGTFLSLWYIVAINSITQSLNLMITFHSMTHLTRAGMKGILTPVSIGVPEANRPDCSEEV